jgi:hypothetical protein
MQEDRVVNYQWEVANIGNENLRPKQNLWTVVPQSRWSHYAVRQYLWVWLSASDKDNQMDES